jgi:hypothetical protein
LLKLHHKLSGISRWNKARQQRKNETDERERQAETAAFKLFTFAVTLVAMSLGMSFLPLFPQPLPILLAFLVAFITYQKPQFGMPIGGAVIGLGLIFHLSELYFISFLGGTTVRIVFIVIWMVLFTVLPALFNRYRSALAIDFGILAVVALFFEPTIFLAIPLILASAVFFKKFVSLTLIYYVLLSVPLQLMQYYQYTVLLIERTDWWVAPGSAPPLFGSLSSISQDLTSAMSQFRLYDSSQILYNIAGQTTWIPDWTGRTITEVLTQYLDSVPGIVIFIIIIAGLIAAMLFFTRILVKENFIGSADRLLPCITATLTAALFFILATTLQTQLAFRADINATTMILGIFATLLLTMPILFMDNTPKQHTTNQEIATKAQMLLDKTLTLENQIKNVTKNTPVNTRLPEGKIIILKETLQDTLKRATQKEFQQQELDEQFTNLNKQNKDHETIETELNTLLYKYQVFSTCEFTNWIGKLRAAELPIQTTLNINNQKQMPIEERIETIKQIIQTAKNLTQEVTTTAIPIYNIIQPLYDPTLPPKSKAIEFAQEKLSTNQAPWIALEALYNALNNWTRQYSPDIQTTNHHLQHTLKPIANLLLLNNQTQTLTQAFGNNTQKILTYAKKAKDIQTAAEHRAKKEKLTLHDVVELTTDVQNAITLSTDILSILYTNLTHNQETITNLLPTQDYIWEKNTTLHKQLEKTLKTLTNTTPYPINQILETLPLTLNHINEAIQTLTIYADRKEFLLNYPTAKTTITQQLEQKEKLTPSDLPFHPQFAAQYLQLYYTQHYDQYIFDKTESVLKKRQQTSNQNNNDKIIKP